MKYYINVRLLPNPEISVRVIMNAIYSQLHAALVELKTCQIGASFPEYKNRQKAKIPSFGNVLRLHGNADDLEQLINAYPLRRMMDYIKMSDILLIPNNTGYCTVRRKQVKSNPARARRRLMARHGINQAEALKRIPDNIGQQTELPYIILNSQSSGQQFRLFIDQKQTSQQRIGDPFNAYGISRESTLPLF